MAAAIEWVFDPARPSGGRMGGNPSEHVFKPDLDTFVREVLQNIQDNRSENADLASVVFRLIELQGEELDHFLDSLRWNALLPHLEGVSSERTGARYKQALQNFHAEKSLRLLVVEDSNTTGLTGPEEGDDSNFAALTRDTLYSTKSSETAGGSYGLGKAVLWLFSEFSTVLFNSVLETEDGLGSSPRLIGRTELPWHRVNTQKFDGSGWLGEKSSEGGGEWAKSVWSPASTEAAEGLYLNRGTEMGTSILVVGFRDPTAEEEQDSKALAQAIIRAAARNFWPSILGNKLSVKAEVFEPGASQPTFTNSAGESDVPKQFAPLWKAYQEQSFVSELKNPGDVAEVAIDLAIPARVDGSAPLTRAEASLVVRLDEENGGQAKDANQVAFFRGPGMVVAYKVFNQLSLTQRSFHAMLVCGKLRREFDDNDVALDEFLRTAEPPEHKTWEVTPKLKLIYKQGYRKLLTDLDQRIKDALKELVSEKAQGGTEGPRLLMSLFPLGGHSDPPPPHRSPITLKNPDAKLVGDEWEFSGRIAVRSDHTRRWRAEIDLRFQAEDAADSTGHVIRTITIDKNAEAKGVVATSEGGIGIVTGPASVKQIDFMGTTDPQKYPTDAKRTTVSLDLKPVTIEES